MNRRKRRRLRSRAKRQARKALEKDQTAMWDKLTHVSKTTDYTISWPDIARDLISVQPMQGPTGEIFKMKITYSGESEDD